MRLSRRSLFVKVLPAVCAGVLGMGAVHRRLMAAESATFPTSQLTIETQRGRFAFDVEVADTPAVRMQGLQNRRNLPEAAGMLFDFRRPQRVTMWMKNTYLPLDMLFIDERGVIVALAENTTPLSLAPIEPDLPVRAVLEVRAGTAARLGVRPGDVVHHPIFETSGN